MTKLTTADHRAPRRSLSSSLASSLERRHSPGDFRVSLTLDKYFGGHRSVKAQITDRPYAVYAAERDTSPKSPDGLTLRNLPMTDTPGRRGSRAAASS
ncbi:MAG: hypothetical protein R3D67_21130 [Hyphomicrobiaceae bacterium]